MENKRPRGRERNVTGGGTGVFKRGSGLGTGPTGESGLNKRPQSGSQQTGTGQQSASPQVQRSQGVHQQTNKNPYSQQGRSVFTGSQSLFGSGQTSNSQNSGNIFGGIPGSTGQGGSGTGNTNQSSYTTNTGTTRSGGRGKFFLLLIAVVIVVVLLFVLCGRGSKNQNYSQQTADYTLSTSSNSSSNYGGYSGSSNSGSYGSYQSSSYNDYFSSLFGGNSSYSTGWTDSGAAASAALNTSVAQNARDKRTQILGGGRDQVTIMVYMCGADLESKSGMASSDLQEMTKADLSNINLIVYTGGASRWMNSVISSSNNQIYQVRDGGVVCLNDNAGRVSMTEPSTLSAFIKWTASNFPANRYELIFWDHGAGTVNGYGYDEKFPSSGSMGLSGINKALKDGGVTFDLIGFDTCLMATMENALMLNSYADYLVASEETEPGYGWYYTDWLTEFNSNTSMPTIEIGKNIVDDFISTCARQVPGQKATLSLVDLAELSSTAPSAFSAFSKSISGYISDSKYKQVSDARNMTREFGSSSKIDMVDLVNFAENLGNDESIELAGILKNAIKYNRTSSGMTNAYGLSIFFPYKSAKYVDMVTNTYSAIGMDADYAQCIKSFARLEVCGQAGTGGYASPYGSLFGSSSGSYSPYSVYDYSDSYGSSDSYSSYSSSSDMISSLLGNFLGGDYSSILGISGRSAFMEERSMSDADTIQYIQENSIDMADLVFEEYSDGSYRLDLSEKEWSLVHDIGLNMFYDDGEGYINLGVDAIMDFDEENRLVADPGEYWLSINGQPVSYFHMDTVDDGENYVITGRVPAILNGEDRIDLIIVFNNDNPKGYIAGAYYVYQNDDIMVPKNLTELAEGDTLDFICDYYDYDGNYQESYFIGNQLTYSDDMVISDTALDADRVLITYKFTDIYDQEYWTEPIAR